MKKSIMIIEGIDRVGKTTLINKLKKYFKNFENANISVFKDDFIHGSVGKKVYQEKVYTTLNILRNFQNIIDENSIILMDRFYMTEEVYGLVDRGYKPKLSDLTEELLLKTDYEVLTVFVDPVNLLKSEKEHGNSLSNHLKVFENILKRTKLKLVRTDYNEINDNFENLIRRIKNEIK